MKKSSADLSIIGSTDVINASMSFPKFQRPQIKFFISTSTVFEINDNVEPFNLSKMVANQDSIEQNVT
jgi:hypothetical protein